MAPLDFTVIDCETTGVYTRDRIIELALVRVGPDGKIRDRFVSLINPERDLGPTSVHGITSSQILSAPRFSEIIGSALEILNGTIPVAHNASFDRRLVGAEMSRAGLAFLMFLGFAR